MAMAIVILSNEGGKDKALIVAASREDAKAVAGIARKCTGSRYLGIDNPKAIECAAEAWDMMGRKWQEAHREAEKGTGV